MILFYFWRISFKVSQVQSILKNKKVAFSSRFAMWNDTLAIFKFVSRKFRSTIVQNKLKMYHSTKMYNNRKH